MCRRYIDAHCHLFNGRYASRDALTIGRDISRGEYRLVERPTDAMPVPFNPPVATSWQARLESLVGLFTVMKESCAENYARECEEFAASAFAPAQLHLMPMMMDIYYIFSHPYSEAFQATATTAVNDGNDWFEGWKERLAEKIDQQVQKSLTRDTFTTETEQSARDIVRVKIRSFAAEIETYLRDSERLAASSIDFAGMPVSWGYQTHLEDLLSLQQSYPDRVFPSIAIDPRRPKMLDFLTSGKTVDGRQLLSQDGPFYGVKVYPPLGYHPFAAPLMEVYRYCEAHGFPVTAHCQQVSFFNAISGSECDANGEYFAHPKHWIPVLQAFPNLRLDLAHFGGEESVLAYAGDPRCADAEWTRVIVELLQYPHVYTDSAAITRFGAPRAIPEIIRREPLVGKKMMFGSDFIICILRDDLDGRLRNYFDLYRDVSGTEWHDNAGAFLPALNRQPGS